MQNEKSLCPTPKKIYLFVAEICWNVTFYCIPFQNRSLFSFLSSRPTFYRWKKTHQQCQRNRTKEAALVGTQTKKTIRSCVPRRAHSAPTLPLIFVFPFHVLAIWHAIWPSLYHRHQFDAVPHNSQTPSTSRAFKPPSQIEHHIVGARFCRDDSEAHAKPRSQKLSTPVMSASLSWGNASEPFGGWHIEW